MLDTIPEDILRKILHHLAYPDILKCRQLNSSIRAIIDEPDSEVQLKGIKRFFNHQEDQHNNDSRKKVEEELDVWTSLGQVDFGSDLKGPFELLVENLPGLLDNRLWRLIDVDNVHLHQGSLYAISHAYTFFASPSDDPGRYIRIYRGILTIDLEVVDTQAVRNWLDRSAPSDHNGSYDEALPPGVNFHPLPEGTVAYQILRDRNEIVLAVMNQQSDSPIAIKIQIYDLVTLESQCPSRSITIPWKSLVSCTLEIIDQTSLVKLIANPPKPLSQSGLSCLYTNSLDEMLLLRCTMDDSHAIQMYTFSGKLDSTTFFTSSSCIPLSPTRYCILTLCHPPEFPESLSPVIDIFSLETGGELTSPILSTPISRSCLARYSRPCHCCGHQASTMDSTGGPESGDDMPLIIRNARLRTLLTPEGSIQLIGSLNLMNKHFTGEFTFSLGSIHDFLTHLNQSINRSSKILEWNPKPLIEWDNTQCQAWSHPTWGTRFFGECMSLKSEEYFWSFGYNIPSKRLLGIDKHSVRQAWLGRVAKEDMSMSWRGRLRRKYQVVRSFYAVGGGGQEYQFCPFEVDYDLDSVLTETVSPIISSSFSPRISCPRVLGVDEKRIIVGSCIGGGRIGSIWILDIPKATARILEMNTK